MTIAKITYRDKEYLIPFAPLFRELTDRERHELRASIQALGVLSSVFVYISATWRAPCVIDGANRLALGAELNIAVPMQQLPVADETARHMAEDLNIARRQVTPEEARVARAQRIIRVVAAREEGKSLRAIAASEGVSAPQVLADLRDAGVNPLTPDRIQGTDGKSYPTSRPTQPDDAKEFTPEQPTEAAPESPPQSLAPVPSRKLPNYFKPGNNSDPDHPYAKIFAAMVQVAKLINAQMNDPEDKGRLAKALGYHNTTKCKCSYILFPQPKFEAGKGTTGERYTFTGFRRLRYLMRKAGKYKAAPTDKQLRTFLEGFDESAPAVEECDE